MAGKEYKSILKNSICFKLTRLVIILTDVNDLQIKVSDSVN